MSSATEYPELDDLFGIYFNQDFELWGDSVGEIVASYIEGTTEESRNKLVDEIDRFIRQHVADLDAAFAEKYSFDFNPEPWGHTTRSFLEEVQRLVRDNK